MSLRLIAAGATALMLCASLAVFNAAAATQNALTLAESARGAGPSPARAAALVRAEATLSQAWSRPLTWHAGALEAQSWIAALRAEAANDPQALAQSAQAAARGVTLAPVQAHAWMRLAALDARAIPNSQCDAAGCLDQSWSAAPMAEPETACARIGLTRSLGVSFEVGDQRLRDYAASGPEPSAMADCLAGLPPEALFPLLLEARQARGR